MLSIFREQISVHFKFILFFSLNLQCEILKLNINFVGSFGSSFVSHNWLYLLCVPSSTGQASPTWPRRIINNPTFYFPPSCLIPRSNRVKLALNKFNSTVSFKTLGLTNRVLCSLYFIQSQKLFINFLKFS